MTRSPEDIRTEVSKAYANRVRPVLEGIETLPMAGSCCTTDSDAGSCCAPADGATAGGDCCGTAVDGDVQIVRIAEMYAQSGIGDLPATVTDVGFGCGNPTAIAVLLPGETVLDLGSGGGIDCFLAAKMVGPEGRVFGVDMTPEMIALARKNALKVGATNVEFRLGEIEHLPLDAGSVDVIISNCVINLAPDKDQVFREALRVLRPGGRLQVSDIVWTSPAPDDIKDDMEQWAGCISGALLESDYIAKIEAAGFERATSVAAGYPGGKGLASANVVAYKPR